MKKILIPFISLLFLAGIVVTAFVSLIAGAAVASVALTCSSSPSGEPVDAPTVRPEIVRTMGHDTTAFTQGLFCD